MGICSSSPGPNPQGPYFPNEPGGNGFGPEPLMPPPSPTWKLPGFPAPALPPLTRNNKVIVACSRYMHDQEEQAKTKRYVLNGSGKAISIVFDLPDPQTTQMFLSEAKKLFSLAMTLTSIEIHTAALDPRDVGGFLQTLLDQLPSHGELQAFSLVTAKETPLPFNSLSGFMYKHPGLRALRLWGVDLTAVGTSADTYYPSCRLMRCDLSHCRMFSQHIDNLLRSCADSLICLKFDKLVGLSGAIMAKAVSKYGKNVQMLTILLPDASESEMDHTASYLVGDTSCRFPLSLKYLHLSGLAASDNLFALMPTEKTSAPGTADAVVRRPESHLKDLVALRLDNCPRLSINGLMGAMRQRTLPSLLRLNAWWLENQDAMADVSLLTAYAASQDIRVDTNQEGLVHLTALKETPTFDAPDSPGSYEAEHQTMSRSLPMSIPRYPAPVASRNPNSLPNVHDLHRLGPSHDARLQSHRRSPPQAHASRKRQPSRPRRRARDSYDSASSRSSDEYDSEDEWNRHRKFSDDGDSDDSDGTSDDDDDAGRKRAGSDRYHRRQRSGSGGRRR